MMSARYKDYGKWIGLLGQLWLLGVGLWAMAPAMAQEALCAEVKIVIEQKLSLERQAFDAHLVIANGLDSTSLENIRVTLNFADKEGKAVVGTTDPNATEARFFIRLDALTGINAIDGTGRITPKTTGDIHWLVALR